MAPCLAVPEATNGVARNLKLESQIVYLRSCIQSNQDGADMCHCEFTCSTPLTAGRPFRMHDQAMSGASGIASSTDRIRAILQRGARGQMARVDTPSVPATRALVQDKGQVRGQVAEDGDEGDPVGMDAYPATASRKAKTSVALRAAPMDSYTRPASGRASRLVNLRPEAGEVSGRDILVVHRTSQRFGATAGVGDATPGPLRTLDYTSFGVTAPETE
jgi:hypothetical protein